MSGVARKKITEMFERAGVRVGGDAPRDLRVLDERLFDRVARDGSLGFGDAYVDGWWECDALDALFHAVALAPKSPSSGLGRLVNRARYQFTNLQSKARARLVVDAHYDLGNDFFAAWLDPKMQYSCAYWSDAEDLDAAQRAKLELVASKLHASPGDRVLEIGCGWGGLAEHLARERGCSVTALNISDAQIAGARERCAGLDVEVLKRDYRDVRGQWDKVVSIAMLEAVGKRNLRTYMERVHAVMKPSGFFVLHTIGSDLTRLHPDRWITERIFPNGYIPSAAEITQSAEGLFALEDWHSLGPDYDLTLMAWHERFEAAWGAIQRLSPRYDERFRRRWRYYLLSCAGTFRARAMQLWQLVLTRHRSGTVWPRVLRR
ncbi:MAG: cyclopropane fatty acyl phospholipid synthase [Polyangiales bacterium]